MTDVSLAELEAAGRGRIGARIARAAAALAGQEIGPDRAARAYFVPGRIEVLGKHTDYAGGRSLVAATEQGFLLVAVPRADARVRVLDCASGERLELEVRAETRPSPGHWRAYPETVLRRLADDFGAGLVGCDLAFDSDLPPAAGLSSSSALITAVFLALAHANRLDQRPDYRREIDGPEALAGYLGAVESGAPFGALSGRGGVGTLGGSEDHAAILCSRAGELRRYRFRPVVLEGVVPIPEGWSFAVAASGVRAVKAGSVRAAYNRAALLAAAAARRWRRASGREERHLGTALVAAPADEIRRALAGGGDSGFTADELVERFEQFLEESEQIVPEAAEALVAGDLDRFGRLADRSQRLAEERLHNQVPETIWLARSARRLGAAAASAFGAGWGGSVWALVEAARLDRFLADWRLGYDRAFPERRPEARFFETGPADGAREVP